MSQKNKKKIQWFRRVSHESDVSCYAEVEIYVSQKNGITQNFSWCINPPIPYFQWLTPSPVLSLTLWAADSHLTGHAASHNCSYLYKNATLSQPCITCKWLNLNLHHARRLTEAGKQPEHRQQDTIKQTERHSLFLYWSIDAKQKRRLAKIRKSLRERWKSQRNRVIVLIQW